MCLSIGSLSVSRSCFDRDTRGLSLSGCLVSLSVAQRGREQEWRRLSLEFCLACGSCDCLYRLLVDVVPLVRASRILFFYLLVTWALHTSPPPSPSSALPPSPLHYLPACCSRSSLGARNHLHPTPFCIRTCTEIATAIGNCSSSRQKKRKGKQRKAKGNKRLPRLITSESVCALYLALDSVTSTP